MLGFPALPLGAWLGRRLQEPQVAACRDAGHRRFPDREHTMANWRKELRGLTRRVPGTGTETSVMIEAVQNAESDRGCALIAGSIAEDALEQIIRTHMRSLNKAQQDQLFGPEGTLSAF